MSLSPLTAEYLDVGCCYAMHALCIGIRLKENATVIYLGIVL